MQFTLPLTYKRNTDSAMSVHENSEFSMSYFGSAFRYCHKIMSYFCVYSLVNNCLQLYFAFISVWFSALSLNPLPVNFPCSRNYVSKYPSATVKSTPFLLVSVVLLDPRMDCSQPCNMTLLVRYVQPTSFLLLITTLVCLFTLLSLQALAIYAKAASLCATPLYSAVFPFSNVTTIFRTRLACFLFVVVENV